MSLSHTEFRQLVVARYGADSILPRLVPDEEAALPTPEIAEYFRDAVVVADDKCLCGRSLFGPIPMLAAFMGTFKWGIQHGHGACSACGVGIKLYHYFTVEGRERQVVVPVVWALPLDQLAEVEDALDRQQEAKVST